MTARNKIKILDTVHMAICGQEIIYGLEKGEHNYRPPQSINLAGDKSERITVGARLIRLLHRTTNIIYIDMVSRVVGCVELGGKGVQVFFGIV